MKRLLYAIQRWLNRSPTQEQKTRWMSLTVVIRGQQPDDADVVRIRVPYTVEPDGNIVAVVRMGDVLFGAIQQNVNK